MEDLDHAVFADGVIGMCGSCGELTEASASVPCELPKTMDQENRKLCRDKRHTQPPARHAWRWVDVDSTCDGVVTGIQIKARLCDIAAYRSIKKPQ